MNLPSPLNELNSNLLTEKDIRLYVKRDDLIHSVISGNKWRKLKYNVEKFRNGKFEKLLTFGGAYSNHIAATARVGKELSIDTIGVIRGDELNSTSNQTLIQASEDGMELIFTKREEYELRDEKYYHEELRRRHGHILIIPEGGANYYGVIGCQEISREIEISFDYIVTACGTATTATGLLLGSDANILGVSVLKGGDFLLDNIKDFLNEFGFPKEDISDNIKRVDLQTAYHFGGYAKHTDTLLVFMNEFEAEFGIPLDQVYTGKMMYGLMDLIQKDYFPRGSKIIALHTGGLQGKKSL